MMNSIDDLSEHSSSDEERDPITSFTAGLPHGGDYESRIRTTLERANQ